MMSLNKMLLWPTEFLLFIIADACLLVGLVIPYDSINTSYNDGFTLFAQFAGCLPQQQNTTHRRYAIIWQSGNPNGN